jgi:ppGpp synthetase/RelA/SpoT-type nucleotidyltranferase
MIEANALVEHAEIVEEPFDFEQHRLRAVEEYRKIRGIYERFSEVVRHVLHASLTAQIVTYHEIEARAKDLDSFSKKVAKPSESDPRNPKYPDPLRQITDLAGARIITFFPKTLSAVDECIKAEFQIVEKTDKSEELEEEGKFGYKSILYLVKMKPERLFLPEYISFDGLIAEIQSRTILQHAWAEMEHDIQYKSVDVIPTSIRRRFIALAGMLEIADCEFQTIQDEDERIRTQARVNVKAGKLEEVEITPDALKSYLDERFGADGRMTQFSHDFLARQLRHIGFTNFLQIDECIAGYDDDLVSRAVWSTRQGQITRFDYMLLAGMGVNYTKVHPWGCHQWFQEGNVRTLKKLEVAGIPIRSYSPVTKAAEVTA